MNCIFCKIAQKEINTEILYEDADVIAFRDANPIAPVHVLIIPKRHIPTIDDLKETDEKLAGKIILTAQKLARDLNISEKGYKLLFRVKEHGGQEIEHIHLHLLGGAPLIEKITW
ncbi:MAG: histidine triad nucleotide-binding protein [Candidatus Tagabacteria bacterium CG09_land_8_20_14_0_10_41_14]|uniref:Histidine triad nucleotide-binding protein n=2 Tax=Candidatus Tagaibacteriota TaxID=1817918 RepID=A0A2H0WMS9_9BACT|nr:MAG: histidine triad nucleotide-binding protein [Candidatus Tagabacteria bacterium CG09_land_8_20_14_0_10_41_14]PJE73262.1 MAG: histidine triad nucleotide-binding protein [Candidatus Tagabacteria bacterium CG10_big_fil_rev_8_21_14_0_10_40_13]